MAILNLNLLMFSILVLFVSTVVESREGGVAVPYCTAYPGASSAQLQGAINFVCSQGVHCGIIGPGGPCYYPNNLVFHASAVMNAYYKAHGAQGPFCAEGPLKNIGLLTFSNPSQGSCRFN